MNPELKKYLAAIGAKGGARSRRKLTKKDAKAMAEARWGKKRKRRPNK